MNWPQNDYWLGNIHEVTEDEAARHLRRAKQLSLSLLYWMQTAAPRPDGGQGWKGLRLRPDIVGTQDGLAKFPYIRESRRILAEFTVLEQHVGMDARMALTKKSKDEVAAEPFADSVGIGSYRIDLHPSSGSDSYVDITPGSPNLAALEPGAMIPAARQTNVDQLISSGEDLVDNFVQISYSMKNILSRIDRGEGPSDLDGLEPRESHDVARAGDVDFDPVEPVEGV